MKHTKKIYVSGRVQGVFFRENTRQIAAELQLSGYVRNLSDGRVEVMATGDDCDVQSLINWLKTGPKLANVSTIEVVEVCSDLSLLQQDSGFEIRATR